MDTYLPSFEVIFKTCNRCHKPKPLSEFGRNAANINQGARDGKNILCRPCVNERVRLHRVALREYKTARAKAALLTRKPSVTTLNTSPRNIARVLSKDSYPDRVHAVIRRGAKTQKDIIHETRLPADIVCDALAELLLSRSVIRTEVLDGVRYYFPNDGKIPVKRQSIAAREMGSYGVSNIYSLGTYAA